jgi:hypothetical protein
LDRSGNWTDDEKPYCYSAFVIEICGRWCFTTAGHVFKKIDELIGKRRIRLLKCGLADYFSTKARLKDPVPFVYEDTHRITVDEGGMDFGLIPLRDYYRMNLEANDVTPIRVADWTGQRPPRFDYYAVLGLPEEQIEPHSRIGERAPQIGYWTTLSLVGVLAQESPPPDRIVSPIPRFAGELLDGGQLGSVKGMSGGPILGITKTQNGWNYACVAVQGSWDSSRRLIYGTPVSIVVDTIAKLLREKRYPE